MLKVRFISISLFVALMVWATGATSSGRDTDGSRMQARPIKVGTTQSDRLSPPNDSVDWRYFRLSDARDLVIRVSGNPAEVRLQVTITSAMGKTISRGSTSSSGKFQTRRRFDPGLYYVSVSASNSSNYRINVQ